MLSLALEEPIYHLFRRKEICRQHSWWDSFHLRTSWLGASGMYLGRASFPQGHPRAQSVVQEEPSALTLSFAFSSSSGRYICTGASGCAGKNASASLACCSQPHMDLGAVMCPLCQQIREGGALVSCCQEGMEGRRDGCQKTVPAGRGVNVLLQ